MTIYSLLYQKEPEGGYTVRVPELPGCITHGDTIEQATEHIQDAVRLYVESLHTEKTIRLQKVSPIFTSSLALQDETI